MLIRSLWESQSDDIIVVIFGNADAETYVKEGIDPILPRWDKMNKEKHVVNCQEEWKHFIQSFYQLMGF